MFYDFLNKCQSISPGHKFKFKNPLYTIDSTIICICLSVFPRAKYRAWKGALKIHALLDHRGCLPSFLTLTDGKTHDLEFVRNEKYNFPSLLPDSIVTVDRAYIDYEWLYSLTLKGIYFITRVKEGMNYKVVGQHEYPETKNVEADLIISLHGKTNQEKYPGKLRMIQYYDLKTDRILEFFTNNFELTAQTIADLYKAGWQVEIFFKWIKQNLKIKSFLGISENAVMTQIWIAMIYYLLLAFIKFQTKYSFTLHELTRIVCEILLENISLFEVLRMKFKDVKKINNKNVQLAFL